MAEDIVQDEPEDERTPSSADFVRSMERGINVIRSFDAEHSSMTLSEVASRVGLPRAATRRFLHTLLRLGYARFDGRNFELTARVLEIGYSYLASQSLPQLAQPILEELSADIGESSSASLLDGSDILYIARAQVRRIMRVSISVGTRLPAFATSMGRVLLAALDEDEARGILGDDLTPEISGRTIVDPERILAELRRVREQGWCFVDQELEAGLRSVAVPVRAKNGHVLCALNVSMSVRPEDNSETDASAYARIIIPRLQDAAHSLEAALRNRT